MRPSTGSGDSANRAGDVRIATCRRPPWIWRSPGGASRSSGTGQGGGRPPSPTRQSGPLQPPRPHGPWPVRRGGQRPGASCAADQLERLGRLGETHRDRKVVAGGAIPFGASARDLGVEDLPRPQQPLACPESLSTTGGRPWAVALRRIRRSGAADRPPRGVRRPRQLGGRIRRPRHPRSMFSPWDAPNGRAGDRGRPRRAGLGPRVRRKPGGHARMIDAMSIAAALRAGISPPSRPASMPAAMPTIAESSGNWSAALAGIWGKIIRDVTG